MFWNLGNPLKIKSRLPRKLRLNREQIIKNLPKIGLGFLAIVLIITAWYSKDLPTPNNIKRRTQVASTQIYDRNGNLIYAFSGERKRLPIALNDIPKTAKEATIAVEDKNFYNHIGVQPKAVLRAALNNILPGKHSIQGGSTITQQYVKNALLTQKRTFSRKIKEVILALELEAIYSKDQILDFYLNEIPYGTNAYGIEAASRTYFNKPAKDLTLAESAVLAAMPQAPTYYSPYGNHKEDLMVRKNFVLGEMVKEGYITKQQAEEAKQQEINFAQRRDSITAPHFVFYVKEYLVDKYGERVVDEGGLKVTTTLDLEAQVMAEKAIEDGSKQLDKRGANNAALVSVDTKTGQIIAMVGSRDYFNNDIGGQVNVTQAKRQPGSSFKPIVYATAFKGNYNPASVLYDVSTDFGGGYRPDNYNGQNYGPVTMRQALSNSLNIPAVKTLALAGLKSALETAKDLGLTTLNEPDRYGLSLVLGGGEVKPVEMAGAFAVFGNEGKFNQITPILKVEDQKGKVLEEFKQPKNKRAIDEQVAYEINNILSDQESRKMVFGFTNAFNIPGQKAAVKTGTTQEFRDAWTIGYTRYVSTAVWVGNTNNKPMNKGADGSVVAAPIWNRFMAAYHKNKSFEDFVTPRGIQQVAVDKLSNRLPSDVSPELITDIFSSWQVPTEKDNIHIKIKVNKLNGKIATDFTPPELVEERLFTDIHSEMPKNANWENPVLEWAKNNGINNLPPTEKDDQYNSGEKVPTLNIVKPTQNETITGNLEIEATASAFYGVKEVQFYIDGVQIGVDATPPYTYSYSSSNLTTDNHTLKVTAIDLNGGGGSASVKINVAYQKPDVSGVSVSGITGNSATISWTTSKPANSQVEYGPTVNYNNQTPIDSGLKTSHVISLSGLTSGTTYHFRVVSRDVDGVAGVSADSTFTTQ